jgi:guanylate kinase
LGTSSRRSARGVLIVLAGTSGAGKGTIGARLRDLDPRLGWSVSWTTRPPRPGERDGREYFFVTREDFETLRDAGGFLEWFEVYGDLKGTPRQWILDELAAGRDVLLEVDVQGALAIKDALPESVLVFIKTPSREEQRRRLLERGTEDPAKRERRLAEADAEERIADEQFDHVVVNDVLDRAVSEVAGILASHRFASG